jgi:hypothetical protein
MTSSQIGPGRTDRRLRARCSLLAAVVACLLPCGCGGPGYKLAPVSGRVTLKGKPLADVKVSFQPSQKGKSEPGPGSFGTTDADGRYSLKTVTEPPADGAVVGTHVVTFRITTPQSLTTDEAVAPGIMLPVRAVDGSLSFEVTPEGTDQADFDL